MKWEMKGGEEIDIKDMDCKHLRNTIAFIERKLASEEPPEYPTMLSGEMAELFAESDYDRQSEIYNNSIKRLRKLKKCMEKELIRRCEQKEVEANERRRGNDKNGQG